MQAYDLVVVVVFAAAFIMLLGIVLIANRMTLINDAKSSIEALSDIAEVNLRVRKTARQVSDIAGTVGRSAPVIRAINQKVSIGATNSIAGPVKSSTKEPEKGDIAPITQTPGHIRRRDVHAFVIADEFTANAFAFEWKQTMPTPDNWKELLSSEKPDLLFIESAWEGNGGTWRYQLTGSRAPRKEISELIEACKREGVPVVFWNKEDPPHFEDFLDVAKLADVVYTTEESLLDKYQRALGHARVYLMPFAAQPRMHSPAQPSGVVRDRAVAFGGMYFRDKYPERREQMEYLLPAAAKCGLDIFSRQYGGDEKYQFPSDFNDYVRPGIPYEQMVGAYHRYNVILNVNSVPDSSSMCARRIFEATACGAAVVSAPSLAIERYFGNGGISTPATQQDAYQVIRPLVRNKEWRDRIVHLAQRFVWEGHCYSHRVDLILGELGILEIDSHLKKVSVFVTTNRPAEVSVIADNFLRQSYDDKELVLLTHGFSLSDEQLVEFADLGENFKLLEAPESQQLGDNLNQLIDHCTGEIVVRMDGDDWYGDNYVRDMVNAIFYSGADLVGKAASYIYFESQDSSVLTFAHAEHKYTDFVRGATFAGPIETFRRFRFNSTGHGEDSSYLQQLKHAGAVIYSADRFNFCVTRSRDKSSHTWAVDDMALFSTGTELYQGHAKSQVNL